MTSWARQAAQKADINEALGAILSLHSELALSKSDICKKIEEEISKAMGTLRGEMATLRAKNDTAIRVLKVQVNTQDNTQETLKELAEVANSASDTTQQLEDKVSKLSRQVKTLS